MLCPPSDFFLDHRQAVGGQIVAGGAAVKPEVQQAAQHPVVAGLQDSGGFHEEIIVGHRQQRVRISAEYAFVLPQIRSPQTE